MRGMIQGELCIYSCQDLQVKDPNSGVKTQAEITKRKKLLLSLMHKSKNPPGQQKLKRHQRNKEQ